VTPGLSFSTEPIIEVVAILSAARFIKCIGTAADIIYPMQFWRLHKLNAYAQAVALIEPSQDVLSTLQQSGVQLQVRVFSNTR
jgi:hypothetical protein